MLFIDSFSSSPTAKATPSNSAGKALSASTPKAASVSAPTCTPKPALRLAALNVCRGVHRLRIYLCVSGATSASVSSSRVPRAVSQPQAPCARRCARRCSSKAGAFANLLPLIACFCCVQARIPRKTDIAVSQVCASADVDAARAAAPVPAPAAFDLASSLSALQSHLPTDGFSSLLVDAA